MKIVICGSVNFTPKIIEISKKLKFLDHKTEIPFTSMKIQSGKLIMEKFLKEKETNGDDNFRKNQEDLIKRYYNLIKESDAILVVNINKNDIKNYVGGNTFLELGYAYVLEKPIYLLNDIPDMLYTDEIKAMEPIIINGDLNKII